MRAYLFYTTNDNSQDQVSALASELAQHKVEAISIDVDSRDGSAIAELYDITQRPSGVITRDDGQLVHRWLGTLPKASDVSYYVHTP